ncbi:TRAP transporter small permease [Virgibacillus sp. NKC19-3]|uniref:TRAP transporter small permease n=1 Tax=Virgibacillus saliphilus TaxID=2831674 RepID=UPI001C9BAC02|nr:TRAP transporter small permease [Virgibacillus sp. NKC19-3]MBY7144508.1 TRAP transporter small permease [Virgibacillus sp. NKC19-3]
MKKVIYGFDKLERYTVILAQLAIVVMMIIITVDAVSRYVFSQSIIGVYEFTERYLMIAAIFLSMSYVSKIDGHIKLDLVIDKLPVKIARSFNLIFLLLGAAFVFGIGYQGMVMTYDAWVRNIVSTGLIPWPVWLSYIWVPIGAYLFTVRLILQFINSMLNIYSKKEESETAKKEGVL